MHKFSITSMSLDHSTLVFIYFFKCLLYLQTFCLFFINFSTVWVVYKLRVLLSLNFFSNLNFKFLLNFHFWSLRIHYVIDVTFKQTLQSRQHIYAYFYWRKIFSQTFLFFSKKKKKYSFYFCNIAASKNKHSLNVDDRNLF